MYIDGVVLKVALEVVDKGKGLLFVDNRSKVKGFNPHSRQPSPKHVPTCHLCGKVGHIRLQCLLLRSRTPMKMTTPPRKATIPPRNDIENLVFKMKNIVIRLDKLEDGKGPT